jgi:hypothetical protein
MIIYMTKLMGEDNGFAAIQVSRQYSWCTDAGRVLLCSVLILAGGGCWMSTPLRLHDPFGRACLSDLSACLPAPAPLLPCLQLNLFEGTCYLTPLLGAWLADSMWGRYKTIIVFSCIYFLVGGWLRGWVGAARGVPA